VAGIRVTVPPDADDKVKMAAAIVEDLSGRFNVHETLDILSMAIGIVHNGHVKPGVSPEVARRALLKEVGELVEQVVSTKVRRR